MQRRKKVGGILDRRFGENDPTMTPEEKALERFVKERQKGNKKGALFDLEYGEEEGQLTHFGESLSFDRPSRLDDFKELSVEVSGNESLNQLDRERPSKRQRIAGNNSLEIDAFDDNEELPPERPKTKKEVMNEVIAKSKLHRYERQQAREDDDDLRAELDKGLQDVFALLRETSRQPPPAQKPEAEYATMNPDRAALLNGKDRSEADKEYDERLRQMIFDQRSKPTDRTMTDEEKLQLEAQRLKDLEERRLRRMRGDQDSDGGEDLKGMQEFEGVEPNERNMFGLGSGFVDQIGERQLGVEDEDEFIIEDNLLASGSDLYLLGNESSEESEDGSSDDGNDEDDTEFVQGLLSKEDEGRVGLVSSNGQGGKSKTNAEGSGLAYTYACPQNHKELLQITKDVPADSLHTVIQRIRAIYHPKLNSDNKAKLGAFSVVLVEHIAFLANQSEHPPFDALEAIIRHVHSLAKTFAEEIGRAFQLHLKSLHEDRPTTPSPGDLIMMTAIASIFPTSDHFHQVVTPASLCMTRYLSQKIPRSLSDVATGTYLGNLCLQYQRISKRYIPELVNYTMSTLLTLAPVSGNHISESFPYRAPVVPLRLEGWPTTVKLVHRPLRFSDIIPTDDASASHTEELKLALIDTHLRMISTMADLWIDKPAFCELFTPLLSVLQHLASKPCTAKLPTKTKVRPSPFLFSLPHATNLNWPRTAH